MYIDNLGYIHVNVKVSCPDSPFSETCHVHLSYKPISDSTNHVLTAGCNFASGSKKCRLCVNRLLEIFTTKRDYDESTTIYMYDIKKMD